MIVPLCLIVPCAQHITIHGLVQQLNNELLNGQRIKPYRVRSTDIGSISPMLLRLRLSLIVEIIARLSQHK